MHGGQLDSARDGPALDHVEPVHEGPHFRRLAFTAQFDVICLQANLPSLSEASAWSLSSGRPSHDAPPTSVSQLNTAGVTNASGFPGSPARDCQPVPDALPRTTPPNLSTNDGLVQVR